MVRELRIDKRGFDKGVEELEQALKKCSPNDALRAWGQVHTCERSAKLTEESEKVLALIVALENIVSYSRQRK